MADLKIIICDVGNAASAIVKVPAGYSMMIDCGCNQEKDNPVDVFFRNLKWLQSTTRSNGNIYLSVCNGSLDVWTSKASSNHERYYGKV